MPEEAFHRIALRQAEPYLVFMGTKSSRHQAVLRELIEWREDICEAGINSRVVFVQVPSGWGATTVLREFASTVADPDGPVATSVSTDEVLLAGRAADAKALSDALLAPLDRSRLARLFGLDTPAGKIGLALGFGGLFASGLAAAMSLLIVPFAATAVQNAWDASPAGEQGTLARAARAVAAVSTQLPVVVLIDDADRFDLTLMALMINNLASRLDGHVLVVAAVHPGSELVKTLGAQDRYGLAGRVVTAEADPDMSAASRTDLAHELGPELPDVVAERIGQRTTSFAQVLDIVGARKLADIAAGDRTAAVQIVDTVINDVLPRPKTSAQTQVLAWAGGVLTCRQADQALKIFHEHSDAAEDPDVVRANGLIRLRDPASGPVREQVQLLATADKHRLAEAILQEAARITPEADVSLIERTVARLAAHRVRADLPAASELAEKLTKVQCVLIQDLEQLQDPEAAYQVAASALKELPDRLQISARRTELLEALLRLAYTRPPLPDDPLIDEAIELATAGGAMPGPESRVLAAVNLLRRPGPRDAALSLVEQVVTDLSAFPGGDQVVSQWRLMLAFHSGQVGYPAVAQRLLAPIMSGGTTDQQDAAQAVLRAIDGPHADIRLQIIILETELQATPATADQDRLRLHHTLAWNYGCIGRYNYALQHATDELSYRCHLQHPDHSDVLATRDRIANWTGHCGDSAAALKMYHELLADRIRVLGPDHLTVVTTRANIAAWTGEHGDAAAALQLFQAVLPDMVRVLGPADPNVLTARNQLSYWTGQCGDAAAALKLAQELLPDRIRVLGQGHPDILSTRADIAAWTSQCGDAAGALRLAEELLPDMIRVLGPEHRDVLIARNNIATWTSNCGDDAAALQLLRQLLPDMVQVLGPDHSYTMRIRNNIADLTARSDVNSRHGFKEYP